LVKIGNPAGRVVNKLRDFLKCSDNRLWMKEVELVGNPQLSLGLFMLVNRNNFLPMTITIRHPKEQDG